MITSSIMFSEDVPFATIQELTLRFRDFLEVHGGIQSLNLELSMGSSSHLHIRVDTTQPESAPTPEPTPVVEPSLQPQPARAPSQPSGTPSCIPRRQQVQSDVTLHRFISTLPRPKAVSSLRAAARKSPLREWLPAPITASDQHLRGKSLTALERAGIHTVSQLMSMRVSELLAVSGVGTGSVKYLAGHLAHAGQQFEVE